MKVISGTFRISDCDIDLDIYVKDGENGRWVTLKHNNKYELTEEEVKHIDNWGMTGNDVRFKFIRDDYDLYSMDNRNNATVVQS